MPFTKTSKYLPELAVVVSAAATVVSTAAAAVVSAAAAAVVSAAAVVVALSEEEARSTSISPDTTFEVMY